MARKNAPSGFGFAVSGLYRSSRSRALTAIIVLGAIWLLNDYRGVPTPVLLLTLLLLGGMFMATRTAFGRRIYAIGGNLEAARLSGLTLNAPNLPCSLLTD